MATVGKINIDVLARTAKLEKGLKSANKKLSRFAKKAKKQSNAIRNATAAIGAYISVRGLGGMIKSNLDAMDSLSKFSTAMGTTTEFLSEIGYVAKQTAGITSDKLNPAILEMTKRVQEAKLGTGEAKIALEAMGMSIDDIAGKSAEEQFNMIADGIENAADKAFIADKMFGSVGMELIPLLLKGSKGLNQMRQEAREFGVTIGTDAAKSAEKFNNTIRQLQEQTNQGFRMMINGATELIEKIGVLDLITAKVDMKKVEADAFASSMEDVNRILEVTNEDLSTQITVIGAFSDGVKEAATQMGDYARKQIEAAEAADKFIPDNLMDRINNYLVSIRGLKVELGKAKVGSQEFRSASVNLADRVSEAKYAIDGMVSGLRDLNKDAGEQTAEQMKKISASIKDEFSSLSSLFTPEADATTLLRERLDEQLAVVKEYANLGVEESMRASVLETRIKEQAARDQVAIEQQKRMQYADNASTLVGLMRNLGSSLNEENKKVFELNKALAISEVVIDTYKGATKALGQGGMWGWTQAGLITAAGLANVAKISNTQPGSAASISAPSGGETATTGDTGGGGAAASPAQNIELVFSGSDSEIAQAVLRQMDVAAGDGVPLENIQVR